MKTAMLETHLRHLLQASRVNPNFFIRPEIFPKTSAARRNASRRLLGVNSSGRPYARSRWPELRDHVKRSSKSYHSAYMKIWRKKTGKRSANIKVYFLICFVPLKNHPRKPTTGKIPAI
jgi:hypothetical protein